MLFSGRELAENIFSQTKTLLMASDVIPGLGVILVGDDKASHLYVGIKERRAQELGIYFEKKVFPESATQEEILEAIQNMNVNPGLHGIIVQLPLPKHLDTEAIIASIDPEKDTDGFHPETIQKFLAGDAARLPVFPRALLELVGLKNAHQGGNALAIVNSELMGQVLIKALENAGYEARYLFKEQDTEIQKMLPEQKVVLTAIGIPNVVSALNAQSGTVFVDGGIYTESDGNVIGDVTRDDGVYRNDVFVSTVPGGVGPVTVAVLLARVTEAALKG